MAIALTVAKKVFTSKPAQVVYATTGAVLVDKIVSPTVDYMKLSKEEKATLKALKAQKKAKEKALKYAEKASKYGLAAGLIQEPKKEIPEVDQETMMDSYGLTE